jgi:hypothetical protein
MSRLHKLLLTKDAGAYRTWEERIMFPGEVPRVGDLMQNGSDPDPYKVMSVTWHVDTGAEAHGLTAVVVAVRVDK